MRELRRWVFLGCFPSFFLLATPLASSQDALYFTKTTVLHGLELIPRDRYWLEAQVDADIYRLSPIAPDGEVTRITYYANGEGGAARDPEIGPNGLFLYYSARESYDHGWQIYRRHLLTGEVTALTSSPPGEPWYDNLNPRVVGTSTVAFLSNRLMIFDEYGKRVTTQLWTMDLNGGNPISHTGNLSGTVTVESGPNGIITSDFAYRPMTAGTTTKDNMLPWYQNLDGSGHRPVWGFHWTKPRNSNQGFQDKLFFKPSPDGTRAVFTGVVRRYSHPDLAAGWLATTELPVLGPEHGFTIITPGVPYDDPGPSPVGRYRRAVWVNDSQLVAVWSPGGVALGDPPQWQLVTLGADGSSPTPLLSDSEFHFLQPTVARVRSVPPSPVIVPDELATFICDNALNTEEEYVHMPFVSVDPSDSRTLPVRVHGILGSGFQHSDFYNRTPRDHTFIGDVKAQNIFRYLGSVPLAADGSFSMRVPANQPITFMLTNEHGLTTRVMSTHVRGAPGEVRRCGGCHTPTTPLKSLDELLCPTDPAEIPVLATPEDIDFQDDVQPVLQEKCTSCHSGPNPAFGLNLSDGRTLLHTVGFRSLSHLSPERFGYPEWFDLRYTSLGSLGFGGIDSPLMCILTGTQIIAGKNALKERISELHADHAGLLTPPEVEKFTRWCSIPNLFGPFYRYVPRERIDVHDYPRPDPTRWPAVEQILTQQCRSCHSGVATATPVHRFIVSDTASMFAFEGDYLKPTYVRAGFYCDFDAPAPESPLVRLPRGHDGHPLIWSSPYDPSYQTLLTWIESGQEPAADPTQDPTPPSTPEGLMATALGESVNLSWLGASDPQSGISHYRVYRDGAEIASATSPVVSDSGLTLATTYVYAVAAVNGAGLVSTPSLPLTLTTLSDADPPSIPQGLTATVQGPTRIELTWQAASDPETGIQHYIIYRDDTPIANSATLSFSDAALTPSTSYTYEVAALNGENLLSLPSESVSATTSPDSTPPSAPPGLTAVAVTAVTVALSWQGASDAESGIDHYVVYRDALAIATTTTLTFNDLELAPGTEYNYEVAAVNGEGLTSLPSDPLSVTTPTILDPTLLAHWTLDDGGSGVVHDIVGGVVGLVNGVTTSVGGITGQALELDGSTAYVDMTDVLDFHSTPAFSIALWFYPVTIDIQDQRTLVSKWTGSSSVERAYRVEIDTDRRVVSHLARQTDVVKTATAVDPGVWYHIVLTVDQAQDTVSLYLDGVAEDINATFNAELGDSPAPFNLGQRANGTQRFHGRLDEVQVWQRALSPGEVATLFESGTAVDDLTPPSIPQGLTASAQNATSIALTWQAASDRDSGIDQYVIYRNGVAAATATALTAIDGGLLASHTYSYEVTAFNGAGLESNASSPVSATTLADTTPPSMPQGLSATALGDSEVTLEWQGATDSESGVLYYLIYRDGEAAATASFLIFTDHGLIPATALTYEVAAVNGDGLVSARSLPLIITTLSDATPPSVPQGLTATAQSDTSVELTWQASSDSETGIDHYVIYRDGAPVATSSALILVDGSLLASHSYSYEVTALNDAGLESGAGPAVWVTTLPDTTPPSAPQDLGGVAMSDTTVVLTWQEANDPESGIAYYTISRDGVTIANAAALTFTDRGLTPATSFSYEVVAVNGDGLASPPSPPFGVTTLSDSTPPSAPQGLSATALSDSSIELTWQEASDPETGIRHYIIYRDGQGVATSNVALFLDDNLTASHTYTYEVAALNDAGLESSPSPPVLATTLADATPPSAPEGLVATAVGPTEVTVTWQAASDPETGIDHYRIARDGQEIATVTALVFTDSGLTPTTSFTYVVTAVNGDNLESGPSAPLTIATASDATPPSPPSGLTGAARSDTSIELTWQEASDPETGIAHYVIDRDGQGIATTTALSFVDTGLVPSTAYTYRVTALNGESLESPASGPVTLTTLPDASPPSVPAGLVAGSVTPTSVTLGWQAANDPETGILHYVIYRDEATAGSTSALTFTDLGLPPLTSFSYTVTAVNGDAGESAPSAPITVTTSADATPPSAPQQLTAASVTDSTVTLTWQEASDAESGISHYVIHRDGSAVATPTALTFTDLGLFSETTYRYEVAAVNGAGLSSLLSAPLSVATNAIVDPTLIAHWPLNDVAGGVAHDVTGAFDGSIEGSFASTAGRHGSALELDGATAYVDMGDVLDFHATPAFTIALWFYPLSIETQDQRSLISKWIGSKANDRAYRLEIDTDRRIVTHLARRTNVVKSATAVASGEWHHVVLTVDQAQKSVALYLDGVLESVASNFGRNLGNSTAPLNFGQRPDGSQRFHGRLDEVRAWERALTAEEIAALYNANE